MSPILIALTLLILFGAAFIKSLVGFGESLIAIPLLTLILGIQVAAPLVSLMAASVTILLLAQGWQRIDLRETWQLILAAMIGVPIGVWGLRSLPAELLTTALGVLLILTGLYYLMRPAVAALHGAYWAYLFGFLSGVLGGAYNMASPPIIVYGAARRWDPERFRVTLQSFFLIVSLMILVGHASAGFWTREVLSLFGLSIPVVLLAYGLGNRVHRNMATQQFERLVYIGLVVLGGALLL